MKKAKHLHRPSLKNWECDGLFNKFPAFTEEILNKREKYESFILDQRSLIQNSHGTNNITEMINVPKVIDSKRTSPQQFIEEYEARKIPTVIKGIPYGCGEGDQKEWPAVKDWTLEKLGSDPSISRRFFKVGEDDDGKSLKLKMKYFLKYLNENKDDSPLYVFDSAFDEDKKAKKLLDDFIVPRHFDEDLFHLVGESRRPPYRWFLVGPERSGSTIHIDPLATSAWNTLIYGKKRWVLFPPNVPKRIVKGTDLIRKGEDDEAIHYFMYILPRIKQKAASQSSWKDSNKTSGSHNPYQNFRCYEFTQNAGETVFIPNGWWHAVLNLTHTIGITQNFCSHRNFDDVWKKSRGGRKKMAWKWLCRLDNEYPHLANKARQLNEQDRFVMKYDPVEVRKRETERKVAKAQKKHKKISKKNHSSRRVKDGNKACSYGSDTSETRNKRRRIVSPSVSP